MYDSKWTSFEMMQISVDAALRGDDPEYQKIKTKFERCLNGEIKRVQLSNREKHLISDMYKNSKNLDDLKLLDKLYNLYC